MNSNADCGLIVFIRNPVQGMVKTRIAQTLGPVNALRIYRHLLTYTQQLALHCTAQRFLFYSDTIDEMDDWENDQFIKKVQTGNDLGGRMNNAFAQLFREDYKRLVIIGSDCLELTPGIIHEAFNQLKENEVVIGPGEDGGYYLLGMSVHLPQIFNNKNWGSNTVFSDTIAQLKAAGLKVSLLPVLNDIDEEKDLPPNWQQWPGMLIDDGP